MVAANFLIELRDTGAVGHTSRHKDIIKVGINITFQMVLRVASPSKFLAGLTAKLSIVMWGEGHPAGDAHCQEGDPGWEDHKNQLPQPMANN